MTVNLAIFNSLLISKQERTSCVTQNCYDAVKYASHSDKNWWEASYLRLHWCLKPLYLISWKSQMKEKKCGNTDILCMQQKWIWMDPSSENTCRESGSLPGTAHSGGFTFSTAGAMQGTRMQNVTQLNVYLSTHKQAGYYSCMTIEQQSVD